MILLILFYFAVMILAAMLIVFGLISYLRSRELSAPKDQKQFDGPPVLRPLFAPSESDIRAFEQREKVDRARIAQAEKDAAAAEETLRESNAARALLTEWRGAPGRRNTIELLKAAAESGSAQFFSECAENVIKIFYEVGLDGLTAAEVADLLESHLGLLPQQERVSGALFWTKQNITDLRRQQENRSAE